MIFLLTKKTSSDMVTMHLPTGLLIEYFLRFVLFPFLFLFEIFYVPAMVD